MRRGFCASGRLGGEAPQKYFLTHMGGSNFCRALRKETLAFGECQGEEGHEPDAGEE